MISVVVATYNGEKFITEQLNSIKNQNCQPDEVIIRDDRSSDATAEIVRKYIKENNLINWDFEINSENKGYKKIFMIY
ncbi:glycosyltransferase [Liquorilactobacillus mali]|uniref:glycosyltransferase n=1 Tax=Liquorilactobacillus mali TaxID=1618 RepID=UPI001F04BC3F|nr:glycosyltransferase [Liquorilactobacillus mali]